MGAVGALVALVTTLVLTRGERRGRPSAVAEPELEPAS